MIDVRWAPDIALAIVLTLAGCGVIDSGPAVAAVGQPTEGCTTNIPGLGDKTEWHFSPAPNGGWDWDCDGLVSQQYSVSTYVCHELVDEASCDNAPAGSYLLNPTECGASGPIQDMTCQWAGTLCMPVFQVPTTVKQGCR